MTLTSLQALTWSTVTGAVVSALLLASGESGLPELSRLLRVQAAPRSSPPQEPAAQAGKSVALERHQPAPETRGR